jgi:ribosomal protein S18 acetylase RimI-like enzyme
MSLTIDAAKPADLAVLVDYNCALAEETEGRPLDRSLVERGASAVLADPAKGLYLLARRAGQVVGQLLITYEWSDWRNGTFFWLQSVYVAPSSRRSGVYRALYDHVVEHARRSGACGVRLYVDRDNHAGRATYAALGMHLARYDMFEVDFVL